MVPVGLDVGIAPSTTTRDRGSVRTGLLSRPRPSISTVTTSPDRRNSPRAAPTPSGVPVVTMSPGSSVTVWLAAATRCQMSKIRSLVRASCFRLSLTHSRKRRSCGSFTSHAGVTPGPIGRKVSRPFDLSQSHSEGWRWIRGPLVESPGRDVVANGVPGNVGPSALGRDVPGGAPDDDRELALPVDVGVVICRDLDRVAPSVSHDRGDTQEEEGGILERPLVQGSAL